jgi:ADP-heptose:LPS heptosyltransferase
MLIRENCRHFRGDIPCQPHKTKGVHCQSCPDFSPMRERILIVKLGAAGDVIRTTPLLRKLREESPQAEIVWLTRYPEFVPSGWVDRVFDWRFEHLMWLQRRSFDLAINLDKDAEALAFISGVQATQTMGFMPDRFGKCRPVDAHATPKWLTGLFDDVSAQNRMSYPQEVFAICHREFTGEKYILDLPDPAPNFDLPIDRRIVGLNTGCGGRWTTRLWGRDNWIRLAKLIWTHGDRPLLLGGPDEDVLNREIAANSPSAYLGTFPLKDFMHLVNRTSAVVTSVTMAMHLAIGLEKPLILLNNIFNRYEFELYGKGEILEPDKLCLCCYRSECPEECLATITPEQVFEALQRQLND